MKLNYIRENLYVLKLDYGQPVDIYKTTSVLNLKTGLKTLSRTKLSIDNAIVLPSLDILRGKSVYEKAFLQHNRPISESSLDVADRVIILDATDVPDDFDLQPNDYLIIHSEIGKNVRYDIKSIDQYEFDSGFILQLKETVGAKLEQIFDLFLKSKVLLQQIVETELN